MNGVILFADNNVFEEGCFENNLFAKLRNENEYVVLPISCLEALDETLKNVSTFKALILDWNFNRDQIDDLSGLSLPVATPEDLLLDANIYSLVYIYSQSDLPGHIKEKLQNKFGGKICFKRKGRQEDIEEDVNSIKDDISKFENSNKQMEIPLVWSQAINQSVRDIFVEFEQANPNWIKEILDTAKSDGAEPTSEVIDVFHHILNESLVQNKSLREGLNEYQCDEEPVPEESTARLYRRILYTRIHKDTPLMTGDIFKFTDDEYGILITPECEVGRRKDSNLVFLVFKKNAIDAYLQKNNSYTRGGDEYEKKSNNSKGKLKKVFNNDSMSHHILPSFPYDDSCDKAACIEFETAFTIRSVDDYKDKRTDYKLNAPYIHQLRQRYVAYFGRYGVPAIPDSLRVYNLK